jgi:hypothetical protein
MIARPEVHCLLCICVWQNPEIKFLSRVPLAQHFLEKFLNCLEIPAGFPTYVIWGRFFKQRMCVTHNSEPLKSTRLSQRHKRSFSCAETAYTDLRVSYLSALFSLHVCNTGLYGGRTGFPWLGAVRRTKKMKISTVSEKAKSLHDSAATFFRNN